MMVPPVMLTVALPSASIILSRSQRPQFSAHDLTLRAPFRNTNNGLPPRPRRRHRPRPSPPRDRLRVHRWRARAPHHPPPRAVGSAGLDPRPAVRRGGAASPRGRSHRVCRLQGGEELRVHGAHRLHAHRAARGRGRAPPPRGRRVGRRHHRDARLRR